MKNTELRIGNYVYFNGEICTVAGYSHTFIHLNNCKKGSILEYIKPIPISDGLLLKFGFEKDDECNFLHVKKGIKLFTNTNYDDSYEFCFDGSCIVIKHVHQLQNLFFALTGEELTFIE